MAVITTEKLGATVVEAPAIRIEPLAPDLPDLGAFDLVCVTSPNGAHALFERLGAGGLDARALSGATVAAIGPGTARALAEHGIRADLVIVSRQDGRPGVTYHPLFRFQMLALMPNGHAYAAKRYLRAVATPTGSHSSGTPIGIVALRGTPSYSPVN